MTAVRPLVALMTASLLLAASQASTASAQTTITKSETVVSGKSVRLAIAPNLKKDCSEGPMPEFKITVAPKNGATISKTGKQKTPASFRCPNKDVSVQALFYQAKSNFTGSDEVTFEIKNSDGQVQTQNIRITVQAAGAKKDDAAKKESTDL
ncbi:4-aminobutyrate aminotransferase [Methylobacterium segetis]|uniref:4-aminobutyrate aminotransferase n=1 Tax=Methylobacterium segetis TaxID=2488750 RepID=UPI0010495808|nr:4-aminobutyrate aminotransferase [Methylobacterium segetis]